MKSITFETCALPNKESIKRQQKKLFLHFNRKRKQKFATMQSGSAITDRPTTPPPVERRIKPPSRKTMNQEQPTCEPVPLASRTETMRQMEKNAEVTETRNPEQTKHERGNYIAPNFDYEIM